jgi:hypothetical protein
MTWAKETGCLGPHAIKPDEHIYYNIEFLEFQTCVLAFSLVLILGLGTYYTAGPAAVFQTAADNGRLEFFK